MISAAVLQIITGICGMVALWLRDYYSAENKAERAAEAKNEAIQNGRKALLDGDVDAVSARIDRLLRAEADHRAARSQDSKD